MSDTISIHRCRICGKLMKRYAFQVYEGDESCCRECNDEANDQSYHSNKLEAMKEK